MQNRYDDFANKSRSQKIVLATIEARQLVKIFELINGSYKRNTERFVSGVIVDGIKLSKAHSQELDENQYFYEVETSNLFLRLANNENPINKRVFLTYKFFFSNIACNLPHDLGQGSFVHFDSRIDKIGDLKLELDYENTGTALETPSSITLQNSDGFFDSLFDSLIWENQKAEFYSWSNGLSFSEAKLLYRGLISDKTFRGSLVSFSLKDEISKLRTTLESPRFSEMDGTIDSNILNKPKRIIFGRVDNIRLSGIDKTLNGFALQGVISGNADRNLLSGLVSGALGSSIISGIDTQFNSQIFPGDKIRVIGPLEEFTFTVSNVISNTSLTISESIGTGFSQFKARNLSVLNNIITGSGCDFLNELSPNDLIKVNVLGEQASFRVESVVGSNEVTLQDEIEVSFSNINALNLPEIPYRRKNRRWHVAGHKLREYEIEISDIVNQTNIKVVDPFDLESGDILKIGGFYYVASLVSVNNIRLNQALRSEVFVGDKITKTPIVSVIVDKANLVVDRDYSYENQDECIVVLNDLAEFNLAPVKRPNLSFEIVAGSRIVTAPATDIDLSTIIKPRDWIRSGAIDKTEWFEVLDVGVTSLRIRSLALYSHTGTIQIKSPSYFNDDSSVLSSVLGLESNGKWVRYPSDVVKYLAESAEISNLDIASFDEARDDCPYEVSLFYPESIGGNLPSVRDMISRVNNSFFGSFYINPNFSFSFKILNAEKPLSMPRVRDEDIISFSVLTKTSIFNRIELSYSPFVSVDLDEDSFRVIELESEFVNEAIEKKELLRVVSYTYRKDDAQTLAERWLLFRSLTQTIVQFRSKLQFSGLSLNDAMLLDLRRLYTRYGSASRRKIGVINSISKDGRDTVIQINDLGNIFNRVASIAPDDASEYSPGIDELDLYGFILDNLTETPNPLSEDGLGTNLIG
jgi:hypothetical protein